MSNLSITQKLKLFNAKPNKKLGQNFLTDEHVLSNIIAIAKPIADKNILEVGAGLGFLTQLILDEAPKQFIAIEKDTRCVNFLNNTLNLNSVPAQIVEGDVLQADEIKLFNNEHFSIIANLPYNISKAIILKWLKLAEHIEDATLLLQKEVAERLSAKENSKNYGVLSILTQLKYNCKVELIVSNESFYPAPKVESAVIKLTRLTQPIAKYNEENLYKILNFAFNQRRKTLRQSLKPAFGSGVESVLNEHGIDANKRAENLSITEYCFLSNLA